MEEDVVFIKVLDEKRGDVVFEGKVSTDVTAHELVNLTCFFARLVQTIYNKATNERVKSFKGLQNNVELVAIGGYIKYFKGVLYVDADDGVLRKSETIPLCECVMMTVCSLSHEECLQAFKCEALEELDIYYGRLRQLPKDIGKMTKLKRLVLFGLHELKTLPEEMGTLSSLKELSLCVLSCVPKSIGGLKQLEKMTLKGVQKQLPEEIGDLCCLKELSISTSRIESVPKRLKELKMLKSLRLELSNLQLCPEDLAVFSKLKHLAMRSCTSLSNCPPLAQSFWDMIKSSTDLCVLELNWQDANRDMVTAALEQNGSIVDGGWGSDLYAHYFKRNKENHERTLQCVLLMLAIRKWRNALNNVPKEMVRMIAMMLWITRCDVASSAD